MKTNKEKLDKLYSERDAMAKALGFDNASNLLTAMKKNYMAGAPVIVVMAGQSYAAIKERIPSAEPVAAGGALPDISGVEMYGTTLNPHK